VCLTLTTAISELHLSTTFRRTNGTCCVIYLCVLSAVFEKVVYTFYTSPKNMAWLLSIPCLRAASRHIP
jgi:hypothetical protein